MIIPLARTLLQKAPQNLESRPIAWIYACIQFVNDPHTSQIGLNMLFVALTRCIPKALSLNCGIPHNMLIPF